MKKPVGFVLVFVLVLSMVPAVSAQDNPDLEANQSCFNLENLNLGDVYTIRSSFAVTGAKVRAMEFQWSNGGWTDQGQATVVADGQAGGWGYEINTNNINLMFEFDQPLEGLVLLYGEYGGNVNLAINEEPVNVEDFSKVDGATIGGVDVVVKPFSSEQGALVMTGKIASMSIGGQELWIDDACSPEPGEFSSEGCVTFEPFPVGTTYTFTGLSILTENGVIMTTRGFNWGGNQWFFGGFAIIDDQQHSGGNGNDLNTNNINIQFLFPRPVESIRLLYGEYGGNLNLDINGDFKEFNDFVDVDGANLGGADIAVRDFGNYMGEIETKGKVETFTVGGQELWIDEVCWGASE
jgi:hypothetical protein